MFNKPLSTETKIVGSWIINDSKTENDAKAQRVIYLIAHYLIKIKTDSSGWSTLYQDPEDGRYWESTYPQSNIHGGGPLSLFALTDEQANKKFKLHKNKFEN
ncbi:Imm27 family immunity protein [Leptospira santarosai]|uniref:Imm27 family immunity protein n=1 Tax=Leptospira santarosai TaxID=28183 RepID=UPI000519C174|nr:Imm27 family immunity protein [Leptospira santarosai]